MATWMKYEVSVPTHPKIVQAGPAAAWVWFCGNCYCRHHLTDGFIPDGMMASLVPGVSEREARKLAAVLVRVRLWHEQDGGFDVHDFLDWNPSRLDITTQRKKDLDRKNKKSNGFQKDSTEIPDGKIQDSSRTRARGHVSPSPSSSAFVDLSLEEGPGETAPPKPLISGESKPMNWGKIHSSHVTGFCDAFVCFPDSVFRDFVRRVVNGGASDQDAVQQVKAWALGVKQEWRGQIPGDDIFDFWRNEWKKTHGSNRPAAGAVDVLAGFR